MALVTQSSHLAQPSKAEVRAAIPPYDESMVKRIEPNVKGKMGKRKRSP
jgi:DNA repair photolyase